MIKQWDIKQPTCAWDRAYASFEYARVGLDIAAYTLIGKARPIVVQDGREEVSSYQDMVDADAEDQVQQDV